MGYVLFSVRDLDLLRLLRWCRYISRGGLTGLFTETEINNLILLRLVKNHEASGALVLTVRGNDLLDKISEKLPANTPPSYKLADMRRRLHISQIALTAYRAGIELFTNSPEDLGRTPSLFMPALTRGRGSNPWANTRVAAIAHLGNVACAVHYVAPGIGKLLLADELLTFTNNTSALGDIPRAFVLFGDSYADLLTELEHPADTEGDRLISYAEAYRRLSIPAHLLACDAVGVKQLQLMSVPGYREKLARAALKSKYQPPPEDFPLCDAFFGDAPLLIAADMDLRRIDRAIRAAKEQRRPPVVLAALEEQAEAVLYARYRDSGAARVFALTDAALTEALGRSLTPYTPPRTQYMTPEGDVVDAPLIQAHRKAGGSRR